MTSIRKIARQAGVSTMTVSRVLSNHPYVRPEVRQRVRELIEFYHYRQPVEVQTSHAAGKLVGCIIADSGHLFFSQMLKGVLEQAYADAYHVITLQTFNQEQRLQMVIDALIEQQVRGIVICANGSPLTTSAILKLHSHDICTVGMGNIMLQKTIDTVRVEEEAIGELMIDRLWALGHRDIGYLGTLKQQGFSDRGRAVIAALRRRHMVLQSFYETGDGLIWEQAVAYFLQLPHPPTAIITFSDAEAMRLIQQFKQEGVGIPDDISIIGCGNVAPLAENCLPAITSIDEFPEETGRRAASLLFSLINSASPHRAQPISITIPPAYVPRKSCGSPRKHPLPRES
jgi:DNA-binding LacI/PurR family transcriptional regulator